ncbi:MAG: hypothetical protein ISS23_02675 [Nanoarchaeota archaeon]|nr:hypothetical protein [Nanoarchaeota archaeon]
MYINNMYNLTRGYPILKEKSERLSKQDSVKKDKDELVGLVYAFKKWNKKPKIFLYVDGKKDLLLRKESDNSSYIYALCYHKGLIYHSIQNLALSNRLIYETLSGKIIGKRIDSISALCSHNGKLYDSSYNEVFETFSGEGVARRHRNIESLCSHKGELYDGGRYDFLYETFSGEKVVETKSYIHDLCSHHGVLYSLEEKGKFYKTLSREELSKDWHWNEFLCSWGDNLWGKDYRGGKVVDMLDNKQVLEINNKHIVAMCGVGKELINDIYYNLYERKPKQFIKYFRRHSSKVQEAIVSGVFKYESENEMITKFLEKEYSDLLRDVTLKDV